MSSRFLAAIATLVLTFPLYTAAEPLDGGTDIDRGGGHAMNGSWRDGLSSDQLAEIDLSHLRLRQKQAVLQAQIALKRAEIERLITSEDADQDNLQGLVDGLVALEREQLTNRYRHLLEVRQLLTPKQRVGFDLDVLSPHGHGHAGATWSD